jgi:hypothetical protein
VCVLLALVIAGCSSADDPYVRAVTSASAQPIPPARTVISTPPAKPAKPGQAVTGQVYYDQNQNGGRDAGEPGVAGVPVFVRGGADSEEKPSYAYTDASGAFALNTPDAVNGYRLEVRTGWFRSQCPGLKCAIGGAGNNVQVSSEWINSDAFVGTSPHAFDIGLIPDAGQSFAAPAGYAGYPPNLGAAHTTDLATRFSVDFAGGCTTSSAATVCAVGQAMVQTLYLLNSGTTAVGGVEAVIQLPISETVAAPVLLISGTSPGITGLVVRSTSVVAGFTTIRFGLLGAIPPGGLASVLVAGVLSVGIAKRQITGRAGITAEEGAAADTDSAFCPAPATSVCEQTSDTYSVLDPRGDDNDSNSFTVG